MCIGQKCLFCRPLYQSRKIFNVFIGYLIVYIQDTGTQNSKKIAHQTKINVKKIGTTNEMKMNK